MFKQFVLHSIIGSFLFTASSNACDTHEIKEAETKLLKAVPNLKTQDCAYDVLMQLAIGSEYETDESCYKMTNKEMKTARKIAKNQKTLAALKEEYKASMED